MFVDRGYRGHDEVKFADYMSGQNRGIAPQLRRCLKRRQATEPVIGHRKSDDWLGRNPLKGRVSDCIILLLSCAGHNLRLVLKRLMDGGNRRILARYWIEFWAG